MDKSALFVLICAYMKACSKCKIEKELVEFYRKKATKDGHNAMCKSCCKEYFVNPSTAERILKKRRETRTKNKDKVNKAQRDYYKRDYVRAKALKANKEYYSSNKTSISEKSKLPENRAKKLEVERAYYSKNRQRKNSISNAYRKNRRKTDILYRVTVDHRSRLSKLLKATNHKETSEMRDTLECSGYELKEHLVSQFTEGMTWKKLMSGEIHVDHIVPIASVKGGSIKELKRLFHYTNLQPLWAKDNLSKADKLDWVKPQHYNIK